MAFLLQKYSIGKQTADQRRMNDRTHQKPLRFRPLKDIKLKTRPEDGKVLRARASAETVLDEHEKTEPLQTE